MATKKRAPVSVTVIKGKKVSLKSTPAGGGDDGMWWSKDDEHAGASLWETVRVLEGSQSARRYEDDIYVALYDGRTPAVLGTMANTRTIATVNIAGGDVRITLNLGRSVIDTAASLIAKNKSEVRALTDNGSQRLQTKAKKLTKFTAGLFRAMDYHRHKARIFRDGATCSSGGWLKFVADRSSGKIYCERVLPRNVIWNEAEGEYPQNLYQRDEYPRQHLLDRYPEHAEAIKAAPQASRRQSNRATSAQRSSGLAQYADMVEVVEGWHLANGERAGRHVVAIQGTTLESEEWKYEFFPLNRYTWDDEHEGFGGRPLMKDLAGYQIELNTMLRMFRKAHALLGIPRVWQERTGDTPQDKLTNEIGGIGTYTGAPPTIAPGVPLPPAIYQFFWQIYEKAMAEAGISLLSSQGEKPAGVDSGQALREYNDITSTRHVEKAQRLEEFDVRSARIVIALARDLYSGKDATKVKVLAPGTKFLESIDWSEVDMQEDQYVLQSDAVSAMPSHPVGKMEFIQELLKAGIPGIQENALRLLGFPDLEAVTSLQTANVDRARRQIEAAIEDGKLIAPVPFQDLPGLITLANQSYVDALNRNVEEKNLEQLRRLITMADELMQKAKAPPPQQMTGVNQPPAPEPAPLGGGISPEAQLAPELSMPAVPTNMPALPPEMAPPA